MRKRLNPSEIILVEEHIVGPLTGVVRLQDYGVGVFVRAATRSALKKAIKKGLVTVDGRVAQTATYLRGGERLQLHAPATAQAVKKLRLYLTVVYEDEYLAVVAKPPGILVSGNTFKTVAAALDQNLRPSSLADAVPPQPVHRLDYPTTGALLVGKTSGSIRALNKLFRAKTISKVYYAVAIGAMGEQRVIETEVDGKPARTELTVKASVRSERFGWLNLLEVRPATGRRHQIRKHLAGIGHPLLGDQTYGLDGLLLRGKGLYLHAFSLEFVHPSTQRVVLVEVELPAKFGKLFPADR